MLCQICKYTRPISGGWHRCLCRVSCFFYFICCSNPKRTWARFGLVCFFVSPFSSSLSFRCMKTSAVFFVYPYLEVLAMRRERHILLLTYRNTRVFQNKNTPARVQRTVHLSLRLFAPCLLIVCQKSADA